MSAADLTIDPWENGASFMVKAHAGSRRDALAGVHDGMVKVEVTTAPEKGKANKAIQKLLAKKLGVSASELALLSGETNPKKRFGLRGVDAATLRGIFAKLL